MLNPLTLKNQNNVDALTCEVKLGYIYVWPRRHIGNPEAVTPTKLLIYKRGLLDNYLDAMVHMRISSKLNAHQWSFSKQSKILEQWNVGLNNANQKTMKRDFILLSAFINHRLKQYTI